MSPTLYEKIWNAINREPRINKGANQPPVTREVGGVEVFNTYGERQASEAAPAAATQPARGAQLRRQARR